MLTPQVWDAIGNERGRERDGSLQTAPWEILVAGEADSFTTTFFHLSSFSEKLREKTKNTQTISHCVKSPQKGGKTTGYLENYRGIAMAGARDK